MGVLPETISGPQVGMGQRSRRRRLKFKVADAKAPVYHIDTTKLIVGLVNNFGYSCIHQVRCKVNNAETESASGINLAYREYFCTLLESDPWDKLSKLKCQGWYRDMPGQMDKWGGDGTKLAQYNEGSMKRQKALVNETGEYELNVCPLPYNFTPNRPERAPQHQGGI